VAMRRMRSGHNPRRACRTRPCRPSGELQELQLPGIFELPGSWTRNGIRTINAGDPPIVIPLFVRPRTRGPVSQSAYLRRPRIVLLAIVGSPEEPRT